jgi:2-methylcitrate dehydratase PrpD
MMRGLAERLADWATGFTPEPAEIDAARRALLDTVAVTVAAHQEPVAGWTAGLAEAARWATLGHAMDYDDVHLPSTSHISVVCVAATLATGGDARSYLAGAGVLARLGTALGWPHYRRGWHTTSTAGAPASAVAAGVALGLDHTALTHAMALAVPAAGGVQRAFGTPGKPLQVGFAADAGVRAAMLAAHGATADLRALDDWFALMEPAGPVNMDGPAVPGGLAIKLYPCCYAMQRPIGATLKLGAVRDDEVAAIRVEALASTVHPLIHDRPVTGLEAKFSLPYTVATTLVSGAPTVHDFTDTSVARPRVRALLEKVSLQSRPGGDGVFAGHTSVTLERRDGTTTRATLELPPGHPRTPATEAQLAAKVRDCVGEELLPEVLALDWTNAAALLRRTLGARPTGRRSGAASGRAGEPRA